MSLAASFAPADFRSRSLRPISTEADRALLLVTMSVPFIHCVLALVMAYLAYRFAWPTDLFETSTTYRLFVAVMAREWWVWVFSFTALLGFVGLMPHCPRISVTSSVLLGAAHLSMGLFLLHQGQGSLSLAPYLACSVIGGWLAIARLVIVVPKVPAPRLRN